MTSISRRNFVRGAATIPLSLWLSRYADAQTLRVRYDSRSARGLEMIGIYADTVRRMRALGANNPQSWTWQWYTHFINAPLQTELNRIFGSAWSPRRALAQETWNSCQSHSGQDSNNFLPWHRMFVLYFESIIRQLSGRSDFTLPYWNYTADNTTYAGIVPAAFRSPNDTRYWPLYRADRTAAANGGQRIHQGQPGNPMDVRSLMQVGSYAPSSASAGFCRQLDFGVHGSIHVLVGTGQNMGAVPTAARDPLFWVHHANIDRLWASWNRAGRVNPLGAWADRSFVFADGLGNRVVGRLRDFFSTSSLGYAYDTYVPVGAAISASQAQASRAAQRLASNGGAHASLGATATEVRLLAQASPDSDLGAEVLRAQLGGQRLYLVLRNLHTRLQPEVLYQVYLQLPAGEVAGRSEVNHVGAIHFFDAQFHDHGQGASADAIGENFFSFDVTELLLRLAKDGGAHKLVVTLAPAGTPTSGADAMVGTIELMRE